MNLTELREELAFSILSEDFQKKHSARAANFPEGPESYHNMHHHLHQAAANFHRSIFSMMGSKQHAKTLAKHNVDNSVAGLKRHYQMSNRHQALATAHAKMRDAAKAKSPAKEKSEDY